MNNLEKIINSINYDIDLIIESQTEGKRQLSCEESKKIIDYFKLLKPDTKKQEDLSKLSDEELQKLIDKEMMEKK